MELLESSVVRPRQARYQAALRPDRDCVIYSKALSEFSPNPSGQTAQGREGNSLWRVAEQRLNPHPSNWCAPQRERATSPFRHIDWQTPEELCERV
jgi:hypothetical protein